MKLGILHPTKQERNVATQQRKKEMSPYLYDFFAMM